MADGRPAAWRLAASWIAPECIVSTSSLASSSRRRARMASSTHATRRSSSAVGTSGGRWSSTANLICPERTMVLMRSRAASRTSSSGSRNWSTHSARLGTIDGAPGSTLTTEKVHTKSGAASAASRLNISSMYEHAATSPRNASTRSVISVEPAWFASPVTTTRSCRSPTIPETAATERPARSSRRPCSMCASKKPAYVARSESWSPRIGALASSAPEGTSPSARSCGAAASMAWPKVILGAAHSGDKEVCSRSTCPVVAAREPVSVPKRPSSS
mmetsp:Transcript_6409/g.26969  ORF Transcript_6409/g.26969 Transcript_6409/m.26969 type:complete len:274 (-) Transcript_6409:503-1324(-)